MSALAVGSTIWVFDSNHRIYRDRRDLSSSPIYREHWRPTVITGETSRSWILGRWFGRKVPKNGPHPGYAFSEQGVDDDCWVHEHRYTIINRMARVDNADTLRKIADLIGWKPEEKAS